VRCFVVFWSLCGGLSSLGLCVVVCCLFVSVWCFVVFRSLCGGLLSLGLCVVVCCL
jgi:hypothetical protein